MFLREFSRLVMLTIFVMSMISCTSRNSSVVSAQGESGSFDLDSGRYALLEYKEDWHWIFENATPTNLSASEMNLIEGILDNCINEYNKQFEEGTETREYYGVSMRGKLRQYVPVTDKNGEKTVWINFFCELDELETIGLDWRSTLIEVDDGGNCFFQVKIKLSQKTCYELRVNGYA